MSTQGITARQRDLIRHALGFDGRNTVSYRNHFVTGEGCADYADWMDLVAKGLARQGRTSELTGGDPVFHVLRNAALAVRKHDEHLSREFRDGTESPAPNSRSAQDEPNHKTGD